MRSLATRAGRVLRDEGVLALFTKAGRYWLKPLLVPFASRALRASAGRADGLEADLDLANSFNYAGITIAPWQIRSEILSLLDLLALNPPRVLLEIGTAQGGSLFLFTRVAAPEALIVSVDLPGGRFGGGYAAYREPLYRSFAREKQRVHVLRADSHSDSTLEEVRRLLGGRRIDFLMIDGDHSYDGVKQDFDTYRPLVADDGVIAFHDIVPPNPHGQGDPGEVPRFWQELRDANPGIAEFVADWDWGSCGIGVVTGRPAAVGLAARKPA